MLVSLHLLLKGLVNQGTLATKDIIVYFEAGGYYASGVFKEENSY